MQKLMKKCKNQSKNKNLKEKDKNISKKKGIITGLTIATSVLALSTLGFGIGFAITDSKAMEYKSELENVYKSNFYSLLDSVNNLETKISKTLNSSTSTFQRKTLLEASKMQMKQKYQLRVCLFLKVTFMKL